MPEEPLGARRVARRCTLLWSGMYVVGIDENGLGPRLGPLVATAATIEVDAYDASKWRALGVSLGLGDSKQTGAFGRMGGIESVALALAERAFGRPVTTPDELLDAISIDGRLSLRARCPTDATAQQCWSEPLSLPTYGGDPAHGRDVLARLAKGGVRVTRVRTSLACAKALNEDLALGHNKLDVDLRLFEHLLVDAHRAAGRVLAICGKIGGIKSYGTRFTQLGQVKVQEEQARSSVYQTTQGEVRFEVSADDHHLPVGIASMVGKYVREIGMRRIIQFYRELDDRLPDASGYHDSVTTRFIDDSASLRKRLHIVQDCFRRQK